MKRRRNPRRSIVGVRTECVPYGQALVSTHYCVLECGHKVEGYPDTRDGRKACPECGKEAILNMAKRITDYEIIDHGIQHSQYFPGCGVAFTRFSHVVTGIGKTAFEAALDAIEQIHSLGDYDTDSIEIAQLVRMPGDGESEDELDDTHPDLHHYVSIRWND